MHYSGANKVNRQKEVNNLLEYYESPQYGNYNHVPHSAYKGSSAMFYKIAILIFSVAQCGNNDFLSVDKQIAQHQTELLC